MDGPSPHLTWAELACHDRAETPYPEKWRKTRLPALASAFERIRAEWGKPITVTSAYRTAEYNHQVGGAVDSQHVQGRALDLRPPSGISVEHFWTHIRLLADEVGLGGVGYAAEGRGGFVHIDTRPRKADGKLATWRY